MSIDFKTELAKNEYVNVINEINKKYDLPLIIVEIILQGILSEVSNMKAERIWAEKIDFEKKKENNIIKESEGKN